MSRTKKFRDPDQAAWDARIKAERENDDFDIFIAAYERGTGEKLTAIDRPEPPDFLCLRQDGTRIGVELTQIMRNPSDASWDEILYRKLEMDVSDAASEFIRLLEQKSSKLGNFKCKECILLIQNCEADFMIMCQILLELPIMIFEESGFQEVWLGDYQGVRTGAHYGVRLCGLFPEGMRFHIRRADSDQKPYG